MWMHLENGYLVLELERKQTDVLLSLEIAKWLANSLDEFAQKNILNNKITNIAIEVQAISNSRIGQVRLVFGRPVSKIEISPSHALTLSATITQAITKAEKHIHWAEERDPSILRV